MSIAKYIISEVRQRIGKPLADLRGSDQSRDGKERVKKSVQGKLKHAPTKSNSCACNGGAGDSPALARLRAQFFTASNGAVA